MSIYVQNQDQDRDQLVIRYVAAACGGGKTHGFIEYVCERLRIRSGQKNFCYAGPTKQKLEEIEADFVKRGIIPVRIDTSTHDRVVPEITRWLRSRRHEGQVLLITHAAYFMLPYFHRRREDWHVVIDEVPGVDEYRSPRLPRSWRVLGKYLTIGEVIKSRLGVLQAKDERALREWLELPRDDCEEPAREILADVANPNKTVFVHLNSWERMVERRLVSTENDDPNRIHFLSMLKPEAFDGVTVMGADVRESLLWHWMEKLGARWEEHVGITQKLRYRDYSEEIGRRLHIKHALYEGSWSKNLRDKLDGEVDTDIVDVMRNEKFLLVENKDNDQNDKSVLKKLPGCQPMSSACHGLNCYQDYTKLVFTSALNRRPMHGTMLMDLGIGLDVQRSSILHSALHQSVMRTALRNPDSEKAVEVIVPDRFMADALVNAIGSAWVSDLAGTYDERYRRPVNYNFDEWGADGDDVEASCKGDMKTKGARDSFTPQNHVNFPNTCAPHSAMLWLTLCRFDADRRPYAYEEVGLRSPLELVRFLRRSSKRARCYKAGDYLFQLTRFRTEAPRDMHLMSFQNFVASYGLVLDFDGGSVSPAEFIRIFWHEAGSRTKHAFIITNSFSASQQNPNKFRVIFPFNGVVDSIEEYVAIYETVVQRLAEHGHTPQLSGLDRQSGNPVHAWYLPVTNVAHTDLAFFEEKGLKSVREFEKYGIRPGNYARFTANPEARRWITHDQQEPGAARSRSLEAANELKAKIEAMSCDRRRPVYDLVGKLMGAGLSLDEIEMDLMRWAPHKNVERHVIGAVNQWHRNIYGPGRRTSASTSTRRSGVAREPRPLRAGNRPQEQQPTPPELNRHEPQVRDQKLSPHGIRPKRRGVVPIMVGGIPRWGLHGPIAASVRE